MNLWQKIGKWAAEQAFMWGYKKITQHKTDDLSSDVRAIVCPLTPAVRTAAKNVKLKSKDSFVSATSAGKRRR